ncbi:MAG: DNA cytosine methyltransferase [Bacteroidia bacterium]|nr:DNA cytosine methyltransferase [Bacteroidia bacterium]
MNVLSFFSGALGLDIGLAKSGHKILSVCEINKDAIQTIKLNHPGLPIFSDILDFEPEKDLKYNEIFNYDIVAGGPPCQAFSTAGRRKGFNDERGNIFLKFLEIIEILRPKYIVIENVRGLLSTPISPELQLDRRVLGLVPERLLLGKGGAILYISKFLEVIGYTINFNLYNSANFGTPQIRERVIIIGSLAKSEVLYLSPTHSNDGFRELPRWRTLYDAIHDLQNSNIEHEYIPIPSSRLKYFKLLNAGQYWRDLPEGVQKEAMGNSFLLGGGKTGFYRRLSWHKPAPTVVTHPTMPATEFCHPNELRPLSIQEYKRVQEFPDEWELSGNTVAKYKQLGNAVPVGLGAAIGRLLEKLEINEPTDDAWLNEFKFSRYSSTDYKSFSRELNKFRSHQQSLF